MKRTIAEVVKEEEGVRGGIGRGRRKRRRRRRGWSPSLQNRGSRNTKVISD